MKLPEKTVARMPAHLQALFVRLPNPGSDEVMGAFPERDGATSNSRSGVGGIAAEGLGPATQTAGRGDTGSAARFFYTAKADATDRLGSKHPTVKPVDLMAWLVRMVCPPGGVVLDPFAGSGTTGLAAMREGRDCVLIEREDEYIADINRRIAWANGEGKLTAQELGKKQETVEALPLFGGAA